MGEGLLDNRKMLISGNTAHVDVFYVYERYDFIFTGDNPQYDV